VLDPALELVLRGALALLLGSGAVQKARDLSSFRTAVEGYELLPARVVAPAAIAFTGLEAALALALVAPAGLRLRGPALGAAALLFGLYAAAIAVNLARGRREIDCGCSGPAARIPLSGWLLARNALLIGAALACLGGATARPIGAVDVLTITGAITALALVWTAVHGLIAYSAALDRMQEDV
jgi:hypothetical protein